MGIGKTTLLGGDEQVRHPDWCAEEPYCRVVDGLVSHMSWPEQADGVTLFLMQIANTRPRIAILNQTESVAVPLDAASGELPEMLLRLSRRAFATLVSASAAAPAGSAR